MSDFLLYGHGGCENHGCEAIVRGTVDILERAFPGSVYTLSKQSSDMGIDEHINLPVDQMILQNRINKWSLVFFVAGVQYVLSRSKKLYYDYLYQKVRLFLKNNKVDVAFSIGGDNYCYAMHNSLYYLDELIGKKCKRVLWGCSVEPDTLTDAALIQDLDSFDLIVAREPITANALKCVLKKAEVIMKPDPAFALKAEYKMLPEKLSGKKIVGMNISPQVSKMVDGADISFQNYDRTIQYILEETDYSILLIPHVTWKKNNDLDPLRKLYERYKETERVMLIDDSLGCEVLKGYIARCDMFIGARTHSTIAAYSSCVPCVVVGYSVKADGIAQQLFGTTENYVIDSRELKDEYTLTQTFRWLDANQKDIKKHLEQIMPRYMEEAYSAAEAVKKFVCEG